MLFGLPETKIKQLKPLILRHISKTLKIEYLIKKFEMRRNFRFYKLKKIKNQNLKSLKHRFVYARKAFQQNGMVNAQNDSK